MVEGLRRSWNRLNFGRKLTNEGREWIKAIIGWSNATDQDVDELYGSIRGWVMAFLDVYCPIEFVERRGSIGKAPTVADRKMIEDKRR